jgi:probable phosphoglycerate mutase
MELSIDGGSRGNPGPAGYGVHIVDGAGRLVDELYASIGVATNNVAEYSGLLAALQYAVDHQYENITIRSDSLLLVCQMKGEYRVKNASLKALHAEARQLAGRLGRVRFVHVKREQNAEADALANRAMDEGKEPEARSQKPERGTWPPTGRLF